MLSYFPALRFKRGEYQAASRLPRDIQKHIEPRFVICPPKERDPEKGEPLTPDEIAHWTGKRIGKYWPLYPAFLDPQLVASVLGNDGLKELFHIAQGRNSKLVAVATASKLFNPIYRTFLSPTRPKLGIYLRYDQVDTDLLAEGVKAVGCSPQDCVVFVDFTGADLTPEIAAGSVSGILDLLGECAPWGRIVFQGSAFPTKNPADHGGQHLVPRDEWSTFLAAFKECSVAISYGDFGADCGEMNFPRGGGGGRPIRHLRYTTKTHTLVVRGMKKGTHAVAMRDVFERVLESGHYAGRKFSYADDRIWRGAKGIDGCGNASMWREWNTAHHMTRVVRDLGAMAGITFADECVSKPAYQGSLLDEVE